jgi:hypothetical protein
MSFLVKNKKYCFEHGAKTLEELIQDLDEDEIPCSVTNLLTNVKIRVSHKMLFTFNERNEVRDKRSNCTVRKTDELVISADY